MVFHLSFDYHSLPHHLVRRNGARRRREAVNVNTNLDGLLSSCFSDLPRSKHSPAWPTPSPVPPAVYTSQFWQSARAIFRNILSTSLCDAKLLQTKSSIYRRNVTINTAEIQPCNAESQALRLSDVQSQHNEVNFKFYWFFFKRFKTPSNKRCTAFIIVTAISIQIKCWKVCINVLYE